MNTVFIPEALPSLTTMANRVVAGLLVHEERIGVTQNTAAVVRASLDFAIAQNAKYEAIKAERVDFLQTVPVTFDAEGSVVINRSRRVAARFDRDCATVSLRNCLRATVSELELLLSTESPLWAAFGLVAPALKVARRRAQKSLSARSLRPVDSSDSGLALEA